MQNTKERIAKMQASKEANKARFAEQTIQIDDQWRIIRFDEYNWQIQQNTEERPWHPWPQENYWGNLPSALKSLPATMLHVEAKNSVADLVGSARGIMEKIEKVVSRLEAP